MYRKAYQKEYLTILNCDGPRPLFQWQSKIKTGWVRRVWDYDLGAMAVELRSTNVSACAIESQSELGVSLPCLVLVVKNLKKYFTFQVMVRDDSNMRKRLRFSNFQSRSHVGTFDCSMPLCLNAEQPWNLIRMDLRRLTLQAFNSLYLETISVTISANCRLRRIYFCKVLLPENELPREYAVFIKERTKTERRKPREEIERSNMIVPPPTPAGGETTESSDFHAGGDAGGPHTQESEEMAELEEDEGEADEEFVLDFPPSEAED